MLSIKNYRKAESLQEAWELNQKRGNMVIAGMMWSRTGKRRIQTAIDLSGLGLDTIEETEDMFSVGCMCTLRQLELHQGLEAYTAGAVKEALRHIVGVQFRNLATIGGSIYGRYGFSDVLTMFLAMDSYVELYQGGMISLQEFASMPYDRDILVRIVVKKVPGAYRYRAVRNSQTDLPVLTCAGACLQQPEGAAYRIVIGARPGRAVVAEDTEGILTGVLTEEKAAAFGAYVAEHVPLGDNLRGSRQYRKHLAGVLTQRVLWALEHPEDACI